MATSAEQTRPHRRWPYAIPVGVYCLLVAAGPLFSWWAHVEHGDAPDANLGYGIGFFWAAFWGLPWSLWPLLSRPQSDVPTMTAYVACGLVNVALVALLMAWFRRRVIAA